MIINRKNKLFITGLILVSLAVLLSTLKGKNSLKYYGETLNTQIGSPFESSNNNGRYALVKSIVENHSFFYTNEQANFSAPDVTYYRGKYFSIFTPGVSFLAIPLYLLGRPFGLEQITTYFLNIIFALVNMLLIITITKKVTGSLIAGSIAGLVFLFATNALVYSETLTQHLISAFLLLAALANGIYVKNSIQYLIAGILFGAGILIDVPNVFILLPLIFLLLGKSVSKSTSANTTKISLDLRAILFVVGLTPFIIGFGYYNKITTGSPTKIAQMLGRTEKVVEEIQTHSINAEDNKTEKRIGLNLPFDTRKLINGLYILIVSDERGYVYYCPVLLLAIIGIAIGLRKGETRTLTLVSIASVGMVILTYAMFGDPWGGWSFGARYMIPANAILSIFVGVAIAKYARKLPFILIFFVLLIYSLSVNTLGAVTTSTVPPKGEALNLPDPVPYTYEFNYNYLKKNISSSFIYNVYLEKKMPLTAYAVIITSAEVLMFVSLYATHLLIERKKSNET